MEFFKAQLAQIQNQMSALSASQKMLTVALLTIMVITLVYWSHWAGEPEMVAILDQSLSQDEVGQIVAQLDAKGISHTVSGDRVMVPVDKRMEILAELGYSQVLPKNFDSAFDEMVKEGGVFDSPEKSEQMFLQAKQRTLAKVIENFPEVATAVVVIDPTNERRFDDTAVQSSGMVMITTRSGRGEGRGNRQLAEAAASVVSGAQAGLRRSRINIVIDGVTCSVQDQSDDSVGSGDTVIDNISHTEDVYRQKIQNAFMDIPNLLVAVTVKMDNTATVTTEHSVKNDPKLSISLPTRTDEQSSETVAQQASATQEPGAVPNVGTSVPAGGGSGGNTSDTTDTKTEFYTDVSTQNTWTKKGPGEATVVSASVRVPRSHFVAEYKVHHNGQDPDDTALAGLEQGELNDIRASVKACTGLVSDDAVVVTEYSDIPMVDAAAVSPAGSSEIGSLLTSHIKDIGIGVLAMASLFVVLTLVRNTGPAPRRSVGGFALNDSAMSAGGQQQQAAAPGSPALPLLDGEHAVAQAGDTGSALDGVELDEETVKAQQMMDQVQQMVQKNPEAAAGLVKRWISRP